MMRRAIRLARREAPADGGMTTAEYAVGTVAACGFGALLFKILTSGTVLHMLEDIISRALHLAL